MRIVTYNIRLGLESSLRTVAETLGPLTPDLIGLQEVGQHWVMGARGHQLRALGQSLDLPFSVAGPALRIHPRLLPWTPRSTGLPPRSLHLLTTPGPLARPVGPHVAWYGVGLISRWPLLDAQVVPLPRARDEQRVLLLTRIAAPAGALTVGVTHLAVHHQERLAQARAIAALLRQRALVEPVLLLGDLNDTPGSPCLAALADAGLADALPVGGWPAGTATFPARRPLQRLDYVLLQPSGWQVTGCSVAESLASDHRPLLVEAAERVRSGEPTTRRR